MTYLIKFAVGDQYPMPIRNGGAAANFLTKSGNFLQIGVPNINKSELHALKKSEIKCGLIIDQPLLLFLFSFSGFGECDSPFDIRLYQPDQIALHDITNAEQHLLIDLHVVDTATNTLKALRAITMPNELAVKFISAAQEQLLQPKNDMLYEQKLFIYYQSDITDLISNAKMYKLGT